MSNLTIEECEGLKRAKLYKRERIKFWLDFALTVIGIPLLIAEVVLGYMLITRCS
jgi:hypothetical protein